MYCIYLDEEIDEMATNLQHIIPLSLGGVNDFTIKISSQKNAFLGSQVEGPLINEFTMKLKQIHSNTKGQSGSAPEMKLQAQIEAQPVSIKWSKKAIDVFDPINKRHLEGTGAISMKTQISLNTRPRFLAKVALESGFFLFGNTFVKYADCTTLRNAIFCEDFVGQNFDLRYYDDIHPIEEKDKGFHGVIKLLIEQMAGSSVILCFEKERMVVHVGILGDYLGTISFRADIEQFPISEDAFRLGHVLLCKDKKLYRDAFFNTIYKLNKSLNLVEIDENQIEW